MHGRDHRPGGIDPIPGLGGGSSGLNWAIYAGEAATLTANAETILGGHSPGGFYTNAPSLFAAGSKTISGTTYYGVTIGADGNYLFWPSLMLTGATGGSTIDLELNYHGGDRPLTPSWFEVGPTRQRIASLTNRTQVGISRVGILTASSLTYPTGPHLFSVVNWDLSSAPTGQVNIFVWQTDTNNGTVT